MIELHQIAAAVYLAAGIGALLGIALPEPRMTRGAAWGLVFGLVLHTLAFLSLHGMEPPPPLTSLPMAVSLMAWMAVIFVLLLRLRVRLPGFMVAIGPVAFLATFGGALHLASSSGYEDLEGGSFAHAHILLAGAGLALLGISGVAGLFYLVEHRRLKSKRPVSLRFKLPSLEALDRVNVVALSVGFPLLSLGVLAGSFWLEATRGHFWLGSTHETWTAVAWCIYLGLAVARFVGHQGARQAAASAVAGFAFLLFAVVGVGVLA